jgi:hypothetical protein
LDDEGHPKQSATEFGQSFLYVVAYDSDHDGGTVEGVRFCACVQGCVGRKDALGRPWYFTTTSCKCDAHTIHGVSSGAVVSNLEALIGCGWLNLRLRHL